MRINVLSTQIANMIAAGEVVERPASVVKELTENSIDAGATSVTMEIKKGGIPYIRISDNGSGIESGEIATAFKRHATSKISCAEDLNAIDTLGFRGEALASIAAVARVEVFSKTADAPVGRCVTVEAGNVLEEDDAGCPDGTTMIVRNLFFNTPARMKFLKNDATEAGYVTDVINKMVLSHPEVAFKYINNGKTVLSSSGDGKLINAVYAVFGADYAKNMKEISFCEDGFTVTGLVGNASIARKDRRHQIFFVNSRNIMSKIMSAAVSEAFKSVVTTGHYPVCVVRADTDAKNVDVNVHPAKTEVRFSDEKKVYHSVYWAVKNALTEEKYIPEIQIKKAGTSFDKIKHAPSYEGAKQMEMTVLRQDESETPREIKIVEETVKEVEKTESAAPAEEKNTPETTPFAQKPVFDFKEEEKQENLSRFSHIPKKQANMVERKIVQDMTHVTYLTEEEAKRALAPKADPLIADVDFKFVGQVFGTYAIVEKDNEMLVIDQHAAHERLCYEELLEEFYKTNEVSSQMLLIPVTITLSPTEMTTAEKAQDFFERIGFGVEPFGKNSVIVRHTPGTMEEQDIRDLVSDILTLTEENRETGIRLVYEKALHMVSCKKALKGNKVLTPTELKVLCGKVLALGEGINTCPHGRPIMVKMTKYALEKQFKREE